ncbi:2-phospho-L-lactate transferase CofD family protein [Nocardioides convexus]|uniref:2-phospho-L-lactate transferase CofD family protein n=1 Tax=Nocardioides convexus TaxID=2712224 RepID=UPI0024181BB1|nr:2-phospho-L-lactate transferase CofD family protein [Nocardioides convexus]
MESSTTTPDPSIREITVLSGGMGGAKFLQGLLHGITAGSLPGVASDARVTVIANTCDDWYVHGLKVCPDLDTVMYTLGDGIDLERGWGRREETWSAKEEPGQVRRGADLVRPRRPRHRHPPGAHPGCSTRATRSPRSPRRCATAGCGRRTATRSPCCP